MAISTVHIPIADVKLQKLIDIYQGGITVVVVEDSEFNNTYEIRLQRSNLGLGGMCSLDGRASYQADFHSAGRMLLRTVINKIAAGEIIRKDGSLLAPAQS